MKKTIMTIALAIAVVFTFSSPSLADPHYRVNVDKIRLWQHSFGRGNIRCEVSRNTRLHRHWGENWNRWIYAIVKVGHPKECAGWVDKQVLFANSWGFNRHYRIVHWDGARLKSKHVANGHLRYLKCHIPDGSRPIRSNDVSVEHRGWIYARWYKLEGFEWDYRNINGNHCPDWNGHGWAEMKRLRPEQ